MSVNFDKRVNACTRYFDSGQDTGGTVDWMMQEFAEDETFKRAKNPRKLAENIITMGGTGRERQMNMAAYRIALDKYQHREREREMAGLRDEAAKYRDESEQLRRQQVDSHRRELDLHTEIKDLQAQLNNARLEAASKQIRALEAAAA